MAYYNVALPIHTPYSLIVSTNSRCRVEALQQFKNAHR